MNQYTPRERSEIVEIYKKSIVKTQRAFKTLKNVRSAPSKNTIKRLYEKFSTGKALSNPKRPYKSRPRRSAENIAAVRASVERSPRTSQKRRSQQLGMARSTLQRIIRIDLHLFPYKIQLTQRMLPADKPRRLEWAQRVMGPSNMGNPVHPTKFKYIKFEENRCRYRYSFYIPHMRNMHSTRMIFGTGYQTLLENA